MPWKERKCEKKFSQLGCNNSKFVGKCATSIAYRYNCGSCPLKIVNETNCKEDSDINGTNGSCNAECRKYSEFENYFETPPPGREDYKTSQFYKEYADLYDFTWDWTDPVTTLANWNTEKTKLQHTLTQYCNAKPNDTSYYTLKDWIDTKKSGGAHYELAKICNNLSTTDAAAALQPWLDKLEAA